MENNPTHKMLDKIYKDMRGKTLTGTRYILYGEKEKISNELMEAYDIMGKMSTIYDSRNGTVIGFGDDLVMEFSRYVTESISHNMKINIEEMLGEIRDRGYFIKEEITAFLYEIFRCKASYIQDREFLEIKNEVFDFIVEELYKNDDDITLEMDKGIYLFLKKSRNDIPRGNKKFKGNPYISDFGPEKSLIRAYLIAELVERGILDYQCLKDSNELEMFTFEEIDEAFRKKGLFSREELIETLILIGKFENEREILDYYMKADKKFYFSIATTEHLVRGIVDGKFDSESGKKSNDRATAIKKIRNMDLLDLDPILLEKLFSISNLPKNSFIDSIDKKGEYINASVMNGLGREALMRILLSKTVKYKNPLTSEQLVDLYGKLSFEDLVLLNTNGIIKSEDVIKITKYFNTIENYDEKKKLASFYTLEKLEELIKENNVNGRFVENFNNYIRKVLTKEDREEYFRRLTESLKRHEDGETLIISMLRLGLEYEKVGDFEIQSSTVENLYLDEQIKNGDIIRLFNTGLISLKTLNSNLTQDEILESYKSGELDYTTLLLLKDKSNIIFDEFESGKLSIEQVLYFYFADDGIDIEDLEGIFSSIDLSAIEIGRFIPDNISLDKIERLFKNYFISHDELTALVSRKIISQEDADRLAEELASHEAYEQLFTGSGIAILTRETEPGFSTGGHGKKPGAPAKLKNDPFLQDLLIQEIGFDSRTLLLQGYNNTLNGYSVYPSEELGVMIFINNTKPGNATYVMSLQQGMFFLRRSSLRGSNEIESNATKHELRDTEHVKVRNSSRGWGKNIVDSIKKLSPEFRRRITDDRNYLSRINKIIEEIGEDYDRRRE